LAHSFTASLEPQKNKGVNFLTFVIFNFCKVETERPVTPVHCVQQIVLFVNIVTISRIIESFICSSSFIHSFRPFL